jgi:CheY-like chemotaxis protein
MKNVDISRFIVIDDDSFNNVISSNSIKTVFPKANVRSFVDPYAMLDHITETYTAPGSNDTVLFLDIEMPALSGWDILDKFISFTDLVKQHFKIFILSSSSNIEDKQKASGNPLVSGFIKKPLTKAQLQTIFD